MMQLRLMKWAFGFLALVLLAGGCTPPTAGSAPASRAVADLGEISALAAAIRQLGPEVDPAEADAAAQLAFARTTELAIAYRITDPPLVHNTKVNLGLKPRGLCWHWADDMEARLAEQGFQSLTLHRAIANADTAFRIDHSTVIIARKGDRFEDGIVLDPWRKGGVLTWVPVRGDPDYRWVARADVFAARQASAR